jgi:D-beta-D-heptose 7-phosphate kinase/D-beta-D-heptose 1-phosphate adenosyltransferase
MTSLSQVSSYKKIAESIREDGKGRFGPSGYSRIVFTNGCFDLLHPGHIKLLNECRQLAGPKGAVFVGVNSDASVQRIKGPTRPLIDERSRCVMLINLKAVDYAATFDEDTPLELITAIMPDVIVKGSDYKGKEIVGSKLAPVVLVNSLEGVSSTSILERIKRSV